VRRRLWGYLGESLATRIQLCGRVVAEIEGRRIEHELRGRQGRLLFAYLAANRVRAVPRAELVEALWSATPPLGADSALSALLSKLRRLVPIEGRSEFRLVLPADAWIDLEAASAAIHAAESAVALGDWIRAWAPARIALNVARRGFLPGEEAPWVEERRRELEGLELHALECVARSGLGIAGPELDAAERAARALVRLAPFRESGHRLLMETLAARDNVADALHVYDELRVRLRDELGAAPAPATQALHRRLLG